MDRNYNNFILEIIFILNSKWWFWTISSYSHDSVRGTNSQRIKRCGSSELSLGAHQSQYFSLLLILFFLHVHLKSSDIITNIAQLVLHSDWVSGWLIVANHLNLSFKGNLLDISPTKLATRNILPQFTATSFVSCY